MFYSNLSDNYVNKGNNKITEPKQDSQNPLRSHMLEGGQP
jgi:hypothetical protein